MTNSELRALPIGTHVRCDGDDGTIVSSGPTVEVYWIKGDLDFTSYIDTNSENWQTLVNSFEVIK
jgi:hypothetical protein